MPCPQILTRHAVIAWARGPGGGGGRQRWGPVSGVFGAFGASGGLVGVLGGDLPGWGDPSGCGHAGLHLCGVQGRAGDLGLLVLEHRPVKDVVPLQSCKYHPRFASVLQVSWAARATVFHPQAGCCPFMC